MVGSVQIRNRATLAGNVCNASPAADTAPALLVYGARVVAVGPGGTRRIPIDDFFVRSGVTTLARGEIVTAIELPVAGRARWARSTSVGRGAVATTWRPSPCAAAWTTAGVTRIAYGSVGPRPVLGVDESGVLADPAAPDAAKGADLRAALRRREPVAALHAREPRVPPGDAPCPRAPGAARRARPAGAAG